MTNITEQLSRVTTVPRTDIFRRTQSYAGRIPIRIAGTLGSTGGADLRLPTERYEAPLVPSVLSTKSVYGGVNGGLGASAITTSPTALGPSLLTNFGSSVDKAGAGIMNTVGTVIPLAIKVIVAVIGIKIVLWLIKGRR